MENVKLNEIHAKYKKANETKIYKEEKKLTKEPTDPVLEKHINCKREENKHIYIFRYCELDLND